MDGYQKFVSTQKGRSIALGSLVCILTVMTVAVTSLTGSFFLGAVFAIFIGALVGISNYVIVSGAWIEAFGYFTRPITADEIDLKPRAAQTNRYTGPDPDEYLTGQG
ncbi:hypothetical protein BH10PAT2_BH10PAT2_3690 [soil metagenome]